MIKILVFVLASLTLCFCTSVKPGPSQSKSQRRPFFYKVVHKGKASFVLGTMHYGVSLDQVSPKIKSVMKATDTHMYEILYSPYQSKYFLSVPKNPLHLFRSGFYETARARGLNELSGGEVQELVRLGIPEAIAAAMSDTDCDIVYYRSVLFSGKSMDLEAIALSRKWRKEILVLDDIPLREKAQRIDEDDGMDFSCSVRARILRDPENLAEMDQYLKKLKNDYLAGKAKTFSNPSEGVKYRTKAWVRQLQSQMRTGSVFIAVGADHLHGPGGLLWSLKNKGFKIFQISMH